MPIDSFPSRIQIDLAEHQRSALALLRERYPKVESDQELINLALAKGMLSMLGQEMDKDLAQKGIVLPDSTAAVRPFPAPSVSFKKRREKQEVAGALGELREHLDEFLRTHPELDEKTVWSALLDLGLQRAKKAPDQVSRTEVVVGRRAVASYAENYIGMAVDPLQQQAINEFLQAHPHLQEEDAISILLDLGLRAADREPFAMDSPKVERLEDHDPPKWATAQRRRHARLVKLRAVAAGIR
jgi:hypothetical protein